MLSDILEISKGLNKKEKVFLISQNILVLFLIVLTLNDLFIVRSKIDSLNKTFASNSNVYSMYNNFHESSDIKSREFFSKSNAIDTLKKFYDWENKEFDYLVQGYQDVTVTDRKFPAKFDSRYEYGTITGHNKSLQVNSYFFKHFDLEIDEGRIFEAKDYNLTSNTVPVILGSEYKEYIGLNEKFNINHTGWIELECEVVGFLAKGSYYNAYMHSNFIKSLDRQIILPIFEKIADSVEFIDTKKQFEKEYYEYIKTEGHIRYLGEYAKGIRDYLNGIVKQKCEELGIVPEYGVTANAFPERIQSVWESEGERFNILLLMFTIIVIITSIVCMSTNMTTKILFLKEFYAILIANGTRKKEIYIAIIREILGINLLPMVFSICILAVNANSWGQLAKILPILFIIYAIINIVSAIYPCLVFKRLNIAKTLQGDN